MILVYLPNRTVSAAIHAASDVEKHIKGEDSLFCPTCESRDLYYSRKSTSGSRWMEIEAKCGVCETKFSLPDNVLRGFWRNGGNGNGDLAPQPFKLTFELTEEVMVAEAMAL